MFEPVLITGGAGFIGANLIRHLIAIGYSNINVFVTTDTDLWRLHTIIQSITIHYVDLTNQVAIYNHIHQIKPKIIFHLASFGGMPNQQNQHDIYAVNMHGTIDLVNACKEVGFDCFINTGSSSEYGLQDNAMSEDAIIEPISDYGVAKSAATLFCQKEQLFNHLPIYTIRPFSVYGDWEMQTRLIPTIIVNALLQQQINLSIPTSVRDFIYIHDVIDLYLAIVQKKPQNTHIFNAGTGVQTTIGMIVAVIEKILGKSLPVIWHSQQPRPWEPFAWKATIHKAQDVLHWQPAHSLEQGLIQSINWFKKNLIYYGNNEHDTKNNFSYQSSRC